MHRFLRPHIRVRQQGQTLVIALIVLGVLLILGLVFLGLINRNILNAARSQRRSEASDLAEAGIRYAHGQLVSSPLGADWRGAPTVLTPVATGSDLTGDPDAYYLRPGFYPNAGGQRSGTATAFQSDLGGPDGLGPFVRIPFPGGRALVRVRYGATDATAAATSTGPLRHPGAARATLIIESVGRPGIVNASDPTTFNTTGGFRFQNYADKGDLDRTLGAMSTANAQVATSRRLVAFAPIGIIDFSRFETNAFNSASPIDIGIPDGLGASVFDDVAYNNGAGGVANDPNVGAKLVQQFGAPSVVSSGADMGSYGGSFRANGEVRINGRVVAYMNRLLGDGFLVSGRITSGGNGGTLRIKEYNTTTRIYGNTDLADGGGNSYDSQDPGFDTANGIVLDGSPRQDTVGFPSGVGQLVPPSILTVDPETKLNRYVMMTRETGTNAANGARGGDYGHGSGVYVDNAADRQESVDAEGRKAVGSQNSLFDDWLNPNSGAANTGWKGPFYVPRAAVVRLLPDGFTVQRDAGGPASERTWKTPNGADSGLSTLRYRLGLGNDNAVHIVNALTAGIADVNAGLTKADFDKGMPFNGILYFEGNVRVRGTIPTDVQMTLVSGATIYIDGSILKGTSNTEVTGGIRNNAIAGLPKATLMLMAKDNVAVNTSMFVGPESGQDITSVNDASGATSVSPVRIRAAGDADGGRLDLTTELALDPNDPLTGAPVVNASLWRPFAMRYQSFDKNASISTQLLLGLTMDDGTAAASFLGLDVNYGVPGSQYAFDAVDPDGVMTNTAAVYAKYDLNDGDDADPRTMPLYGLGGEPWQRYSKFETRGFTLVPFTAAPTYSNTGIIGLANGNTLFSGGNNLLIRPGEMAGVSANDTLLSRAALVPGDVRIEASIFAEQGSFFIIPGPWFNSDPNDTHTWFAQRVKDLGGTPLALLQASRERLERSGAGPAAPFYGEPLDVKINVVGSVAENLPPPIAVQAEWLRKWGYIPRRLGGTGIGIPKQHVTGDFDPTQDNFVPNLVIQYDPILATGRVNDPARQAPIRLDGIGRPLPPMPRLPVSPKLAYFGEL